MFEAIRLLVFVFRFVLVAQGTVLLLPNECLVISLTFTARSCFTIKFSIMDILDFLYSDFCVLVDFFKFVLLSVEELLSLPQ